MVRLSPILLKYVPDWYNLQRSNSSYFKKQALFYMTRYHIGPAWSSHKNAMNRFHYYLKNEQVNARRLRMLRIDYNRMRIAAACEEHGYLYPHFISTLPKLDVQIHLSALARLAIYEPKTFKILVDMCREATSDLQVHE